MKHLFLIGFLAMMCSCTSQKKIGDYLGGWSGTFKETDAFLFKIDLVKTINNEYYLDFHGNDSVTTIPLKNKGNQYYGSFKNQLAVKMQMWQNRPVVFLQIGHHLCHVPFKKQDNTIWKGEWNLLLAENFAPTLYLSLNKEENQTYSASTFFKEPSLHYMQGEDFQFEEDRLHFTDIRSRIYFDGVLHEKKIKLHLKFLNESTTLSMEATGYDAWRIGQFDGNTQNRTLTHAAEPFSALTKAIENDTLEQTHSIIIAQRDSILYERYFDGFTKDLPHDTRSVSKSFASALVGMAIEQDLLDSENQTIKPFYKDRYPDIDWSNHKDAITLHHLLTMSSGLDAIDFGLNRTSYANEGMFQGQPDWVKHILEAPMVLPVGKDGNYGSGSPQLLAPILQSMLKEPLEFYIHKSLFEPLKIVNYRIQLTNQDRPYFGGGWYITPKDLLKFGQLYLKKGNWYGTQLLTGQWVEKSMQRHVLLENSFDKNGYGYLFWHKTYSVNGMEIDSIECRGTGGQYVFIIPQLETVVVITSGNYRNNKGFQPERIIQEYLLKELLD